jgi:hypothetical protein
MKYFSAQKGVVAVVLIMLLTIPNLQVYSAVGDYSGTSAALTATDEYSAQTQAAEKVAWWVAAAEAIALAYAAGYVIGTVAHHAYDLLGAQTSITVIDASYDPADFSEFDN